MSETGKTGKEWETIFGGRRELKAGLKVNSNPLTCSIAILSPKSGLFLCRDYTVTIQYE